MSIKTVDIIIYYNKDRGFLDQAIESVERQIESGFKVKLTEIEGPGRSAAENLNEGIRRTSGEFVKYLSEDDILPPDSVVHSLTAFKPGVDFIHGKALNFYTHGRVTVHSPGFVEPTIEQLTRPQSRFFIHGGSLMYRRSVFEKIGLFNESLSCAEELEFNLRALAAGLKIGYCDAVLYNYRRHALQKSLGTGVDQMARKIIIDSIKKQYRNVETKQIS